MSTPEEIRPPGSDDSISELTKAERELLNSLVPTRNALSGILKSIQPRINVMNSALDPMISQMAESSRIMSGIMAASSIGTQIQIADSAPSINLRWAEELNKTSGVITIAQAMQPHFVGLTNMSVLATERLGTINLQSLGTALDATIVEQSMLRTDAFSLTASYARVVNEVSITPASVLSMSPIISFQPAIEIANHADLLRVVSAPTTEARPMEAAAALPSTFRARLGKLSSDFLPLLDGARASLVSDNPDKVRHSITSLRELLTHAMHALAPDEAVKKWNTDAANLKDGRPTRRCRILFITRTLSPSFSKFVDSDSMAAENVFDLCQKGTHGLKRPYTDAEVGAIIARVEGLLHFWLELVS